MPNGNLRPSNSRPSGEYYGNYRQNNTGTGYYYYNPDDGTVYSPGADDSPAWLNGIPYAIGKWVGQGVNAYNQYSSEFERYWNSPANQMDQYSLGNVNPYEGFLSGSGGNGNPISPGNGDPLAMLGSYLSNFISLAHGMADLRSKNLANSSSAIDLLRKQFENKWFFGSPGEVVQYETVDANGQPQVVTEKRGYIQSKPERDYEGQITTNRRNKWQGSRDKYDSLKFNYAIDMGYPGDEADYDHYMKYWDRYDKEFRAKSSKIEYEWNKYLKNDLGIDPHAPWWLSTVLNFMRRQSGNDNSFGRALFGILKFLQGDY